MKKINWKHVVITVLSIEVLILLVQNISIQKQNIQLKEFKKTLDKIKMI